MSIISDLSKLSVMLFIRDPEIVGKMSKFTKWHSPITWISEYFLR